MHRAFLLALMVLIVERDQLMADLVAAKTGLLKLTREERAWMIKRMQKLNRAIARGATEPRKPARKHK